jgi:hypothetical protein
MVNLKTRDYACAIELQIKQQQLILHIMTYFYGTTAHIGPWPHHFLSFVILINTCGSTFWTVACILTYLGNQNCKNIRIQWREYDMIYRSLVFLFLLFNLISLISSFKYSLFLFLKRLLASLLALLRLSSITSLGSCDLCSLTNFLRSNNFKHTSSNYGYMTSIHKDR